MRAAFIAYHLKKEPKFQSPPITPEDDILNVWKKLGPGEFEMGAEDVTDREKPPHLVRVAAFSIQQHEVTNEEYTQVRCQALATRG